MKRIAIVLGFLLTITLHAQQQFDLTYHLPQSLTYKSEVPKPQQVLRHAVGEWHVTHDKLVQYMYAVAESSDRVTIEDRGSTFEGRPLLLLTITSPDNHDRLEEIRTTHVALTEAGQSSALNVSTMPLVVYQGFSVHGNEPSGANASLLLAYYLAAAEGPEIDALLENTVILLDPVLNPDGLQRFAHWANTHKSENLNTDVNDREFHEAWPGGRTNHYWFDLNRDWLPVQLPESRARVKTYHQWMPNIHTDHHEMGSNSTFFFQPGVPSRVHPLTPVENQRLTAEIGNYHAQALDKIGSLYFTEERYDDFYYGKGSSYPDVNGAVGILFEQGSSRGHARQTINGVLTFSFTIRNQFTVALFTLAPGKNMREKLLNYQREFYTDASAEQSKDPVRAILFGGTKDKARAYHLAEVLDRHNIEVRKLKRDMNVNGKRFDRENSYMVPTRQKNSRLIKAIFERRTQFQDSLFYDISAWTYPLAFNLNSESLRSTADAGEIFTLSGLSEGTVSTRSDYAYLMEWHEYYTPKALNIMLKKGLRVKVGMKPFALDGRQYDYGTLLVSVQDQNLDPNSLYNFLQNVASNSHVSFHGVTTGLTTGIDLGSNQFRIIKPQKVAMLIGSGVSSYDAGEIWHLFDQRYAMNITKIDTRDFRSSDISKYTTIILPNMSAKPDDALIEKLKGWVRDGGNLIGYKNSIKWLASSKLISLEFLNPTVRPAQISFAQRSDFTGAQVIGGTIFNVRIDRSHPVAYGYEQSYIPMFRRNKVFIKHNKNSYYNPLQYTGNPLLSGYVSDENLVALRNSVPFQTARHGRGRVSVFTDNTNFRAFWYGTNKLLMNAIFFADAM
jgi:hypothetical protein